LGISGPSRTQDPWLGKNLAFTHNTDLFPCRPAPFNKHSNFKTLFLLQTDESTGGKRGEATSETKKTPREIELRAQLTRLKGMGGRARRTSRPDDGKRHMPWLKPVEPRPLRYRWSPGRPRVRGAADSSITTVTANRSHSLPTQSQEIAGRHKHQQKEKKKKWRMEMSRPAKNQQHTPNSQAPGHIEISINR
jgi:hypothetical protein